MENDMKKRIATKNFLCEKCNNLIKSGEEYWDWWTLRIDKSYFHKRFHLNCVEFDSKKSDEIIPKSESKKSDIFDRIQKLLNSDGKIIASNDGIKCYISGIHYEEDGSKSFLCEDWENQNPYYETAENVKEYYRDYMGNHF